MIIDAPAMMQWRGSVAILLQFSTSGFASCASIQIPVSVFILHSTQHLTTVFFL